jgi:two-component system, NarL family, response regulator LiaR
MLQVEGERGEGAAVVVRTSDIGGDRNGGPRATLGSVVLLDEYPIWLGALDGILGAADVAVVAKVTSPEAALEAVCRERPDALITSLELPSSNVDPVEFFRRVRERAPRIRIVAISNDGNAAQMRAALTAGADAYLPRRAEAHEVAEAVRECLRGEPGPAKLQVVSEDYDDSGHARLTTRELEIVLLVARGFTNADIAQRLWVTKWTVKFHLANAYRKLGVSNRTQAARYLFERGLSGAPLEARREAPR